MSQIIEKTKILKFTKVKKERKAKRLPPLEDIDKSNYKNKVNTVQFAPQTPNSAKTMLLLPSTLKKMRMYTENLTLNPID